MTEAVVVKAEKPEDAGALVALSPGSGPMIQRQLINWCDQRIEALDVERRDAEENYEIAHRSKWKSSPFKTLASRAKKQIVYYGKVRAALQEGYVIVPNLPARLFAIRVSPGSRPPSGMTEWVSNLRNPQAKSLAEGEGRNVDPNPTIWETRHDDGKGGTYKLHHYDREFDDELTFPVALVKPAVLSAAQQALALKLFDEVGVVTGENVDTKDPILVGRIIDPTRSQGYLVKHRVTFFLGWWLDPKAI